MQAMLMVRTHLRDVVVDVLRVGVVVLRQLLLVQVLLLFRRENCWANSEETMEENFGTTDQAEAHAKSQKTAGVGNVRRLRDLLVLLEPLGVRVLDEDVEHDLESILSNSFNDYSSKKLVHFTNVRDFITFVEQSSFQVWSSLKQVFVMFSPDFLERIPGWPPQRGMHGKYSLECVAAEYPNNCFCKIYPGRAWKSDENITKLIR